MKNTEEATRVPRGVGTVNQYVAMPLPKAKQMKRFGFTNNVECEWYYTRQVGESGTFFMKGNLILVTKCELICRTSVDVVL